MMTTETRTSIAEAIAGIILGIVGGIALATILSALSKPEYKCPVCGHPINYGVTYCPNCHAALRWE